MPETINTEKCSDQPVSAFKSLLCEVLQMVGNQTTGYRHQGAHNLEGKGPTELLKGFFEHLGVGGVWSVTHSRRACVRPSVRPSFCPSREVSQDWVPGVYVPVGIFQGIAF